VRPCDNCEGTGLIGKGKCLQCAGDGKLKNRKTYKVKIPAGVRDGDVVRLEGQGNPSTGISGKPGDLLVRIQVKPHERYTIKDSDLYLDASVPDYQAALGGNLEFETPTGMLSVKIPEGTVSGNKLKIKGKGLPLKGGGYGELFLTIHVIVPEKLTEEQKELYEKLRKLQK